MIAYLVLLFAALSRLVPHTLHGVGLNITAVGGGLLFFGSRRSRPEALAGAAVMALTDVYLTCIVYAMPFHWQSYAVTWCWYLAVALLGNVLLHRISVLRIAVAALTSASGFFLLSNLVVWLGGGMYAHTGSGFLECYTLALPFYANDLVSTGLTVSVLFGLPVVAAQLVQGFRGAPGNRQSLT